MPEIVIPTFFGELILEVNDGSGYVKQSLTNEDIVKSAVDSLILDGVESLVLAHACVGLDVTDPKYIDGLNATLEAIDNA